MCNSPIIIRVLAGRPPLLRPRAGNPSLAWPSTPSTARAPRWPAGFFLVLAGACQIGTAWARLRLNSFIRSSGPGAGQLKTFFRFSDTRQRTVFYVFIHATRHCPVSYLRQPQCRRYQPSSSCSPAGRSVVHPSSYTLFPSSRPPRRSPACH